MNIINRTHLNDFIYHMYYSYDYLDRNLNAGRTKHVRDGDAWPALQMAFDAYGTLENPTFKNQVEFLQANKKRTPKVVLEVGSGCGEVSCCFYHMDCEIHSVDCNVSAALFHRGNFGHFGMYKSSDEADKYNLYLGQIGSFIDCIPEDLDTVVLVESIEHILDDEWNTFFKTIKPILERNHGRLILANTLWPLGGPMDPARDHVKRVDDDYYDYLVSLGGQVLHRDRANLCIQY